MKKTLKILVLAIIIVALCTITNVFAAEESTKTLTSISVTTEPKKKEYVEKENFNPEGMVITATYSDNTKKQVTDYKCYPTSLSIDDKEIEISYTEGGVTKKTSQKITVTTALKGLILNFKDITLSLNSMEIWGLTVAANPNGSTIPKLVWSSSDPKIVTVTQTDGNISATLKPISVGKATVTVKTADGKYSATCNVTVSDGKIENVNTNEKDTNKVNTTNSKPTTNSTKATTKNTSTDNTAKKAAALPKAGLQSCIAIIFVIAVVAFISYKKYNNYKDI